MNQRGSVTALGLIITTFLIIIIGALMPMMTTELRFSGFNRDIIQAQYAAESGAKRAISDISQNNIIPSWINVTNNLYTGSSETYSVAVTSTTSGSTTNYAIISTGTAGKSTKIVKVNVGVTTTGASALPTAYPYGAYVQNISASSLQGTNTDMYIGSAFPSNLKSSGSGLRDGNQTITIPSYNFAAFKASATQLPTIQQNQNYLTQGNGLYYNDGNLTINQGNAQLIGNSTGSVIFVNGNITFNSNFNTSGTLFIITTGNIIVNSGTANFTNVVLLAEGNVTFANGMLLQPGVVVTPGTLSISGNSNFNTSASQFQSLVPNFNTIMTPYASSGSGGSGSSGGNAVVVSGWSSS